MQTIRARLSLNYLIVLALGMTLAGALAWLAVEGLYVDTQRENLLYSPLVPLTTVACGHNRMAVFIGMAECIPNFLAS